MKKISKVMRNSQKTTQNKVTGEGRLPGDPTRKDIVQRIIRVDHAGEYGAVRIYQGQLAVLGKGPSGDVLRYMEKQEQHHLQTFEKIIVERHVRPTFLTPLWHVAGFALGAGSALMGEKAAMACTQAIEEVIDEHYAGQSEILGDDEEELRNTIDQFRAEEVEHRDTAIAAGAQEAPGHALLTGAIKTGSRIAIWLSERV